MFALMGAWIVPLQATVQEGSSPLEVLGYLQLETGRRSERYEVQHQFQCQSGGLDIRLEEIAVAGARRREVRIIEIGTPTGSLPQSELQKVQAALDDYWLLLSTRLLACDDGRHVIWLQGRKRGGTRDESLYIVIDGLTVRELSG
ncbi:hypothetical protein IP78_06245 [Brevundimonas sp. AAP58]|uniref:hypothetical protein n=1 Tax=Brevundimonas sp. AAP58 TaxID=1523422 RepID=UPI0006B99905|nr:hypothetical protein [Brevundimonas sp. AAP58]KPF81026.1 hypothetical protein IP78_06245 [Brevundimonas sp. AAP58]